MCNRRIRLLVALVAAAGCVVASASASGSRLELPNGERGFRLTWAALEFVPSLGGTVRCALTLEGSFHSRTVSKTAGLLVGYVSRATLGACPVGSATVLSETLPWHVRYSAFAGTLPSIGSLTLQLVNSAIRIRNETLACLARTTAERPAQSFAVTQQWEEELERPGGGQVITEMRMDEALSIPLTGEGGLCSFGTGRMRGTGSVSVLGGTARVRVALTEAPASATVTPVRGRYAPTFDRMVILVRNSAAEGSERLAIYELGLSNALDFRIDPRSNTCTAWLPPGQSCRFEIFLEERSTRPKETRVLIETSAGTLVSTVIAELI